MKITTILSLLLLDVSLSKYTVKDDAHMSFDPAPFKWGVASGDPTESTIILWTRVIVDQPIKVSISTDKKMQKIVQTVQTTEETHPSANNDHTIYMKITDLLPDTTYYYVFEVNGKMSRIGRTKTAPNHERDVKIGVISCSSHWDGWYNAYKALLGKDVDFIIHMGDVVYNSLPPADFERRRVPSEIPSFVDPQDLTNWRKLHAFLRRDVDFRNLLAEVPWIVQWDNHDVVNQGGQQAFFEWFPIQIPDKSHFSETSQQYVIDRQINYGPLIDVFVIDTHLPHKDADKIIGDRQMANLEENIPKSTAKYRILTSTKTMAPWKVIRLPFKLFHKKAEFKDLANGALHPKNWFNHWTKDEDQGFHLWKSHDIYFDLGLWDGSRKERKQLLKVLKAKGNNIVVSGDTHTALAADVINENEVHEYEPCNEHASAVEFAPASVSRGNWDEGLVKQLNLDAGSDVTWPVNYLRAAMAKANPHHAYLDLSQHGYGILTVSKTKVKADYYYVDKTKPMGKKVKEDNAATLVMKAGTKCWDRKASKIPKYHKTFSGVLGGHIGHKFKKIGKWIGDKGRKVGNWLKKKGKKIKNFFKGIFSADEGYDDYYESYYSDEDMGDDFYNEMLDELYFDMDDESDEIGESMPQWRDGVGVRKKKKYKY